MTYLLTEKIRLELEIFYLLTVEQGVELLRRRQSLGTQNASESITRPGCEAPPHFGQSEE